MRSHVLVRIFVLVCLLLSPRGALHELHPSKVEAGATLSGAAAIVHNQALAPLPPRGLSITQPNFAMRQTGQPKANADYGKLPLSFERNTGQTDPQVKFLSRGRGYSLFLTGKEAVIALGRGTSRAAEVLETHGGANRRPSSSETRQRGEGMVVRMQLTGANPSPRVVGVDELPGKANYFIGNDPAKWRTNVGTYAKVRFESVYPGVDLVYYGNQGQLEYDFVVAPGVDPSVIQLGFTEPEKLRIDEQGELLLDADAHIVRFQKPIMYQLIGKGKKSVDGNYVLVSSQRVAFELGSYDHARPLVIDPVLQYSTYLGGNGIDVGYGIIVDASGNAYITGTTNSTNFPAAGAVEGSLTGSQNAFVSKLNASGSALVYSTYLGGSATDQGASIAIDTLGSAYVTGYTTSADFPTANALQATYAGAGDGFVTKLSPSGSALVYSTYLGGNGSDSPSGIAVDASGNAYVAGATTSSNFPTVNALQATYSPADPSFSVFDFFISKLNASGSALIYSTYLSSVSNAVLISAIAVDASGNAYLTGQGVGSGPCYSFACGPAYGQLIAPMFISKIDPSGASQNWLYSSGGTDAYTAQGEAIAVDQSGNIYAAGQCLTPSGGFIQTPCNGALLVKVNQNGVLGYQTNPVTSAASAIAVDSYGNAFIVTGNTSVTQIYANGVLAYNTGLASSNYNIYGIAADQYSNAYLTGRTSSASFPTLNPFQATIGGSFNAFVTKIWLAGTTSTTTGLVSTINPATLGQSVTFTATVSPQGPGWPGVETSPTGTVTLSDGSAQLATVPLDASGQATFSSSTLAIGTHSISAQYSGDSYFAPSTGGLTQTTLGSIATVSPSVLNFGGQLFGTSSSSQVITLTNTGNINLDVSTVSIGGADPIDSLETNNCAFTTLAAGASCQINVTFAPTPISGGLRTATLSILDDATGLPSSPQVVTLTGYVLAPLVGFPSGSSVGFGNQQIGSTSSVQTVILENTGTAPLFISGVTITGLNVGDFSKANFCPVAPVALAPGATCTINVTFTPTAEGTRYASLTFTDGPPVGASQSVGLVGTGTGQAAVPAPDVAFLGGGSSSLFVQLGQAAIVLNGGAGGACVWTQGQTSSIVARDSRTTPATDEQGNIWIVWSPGTGTCLAPAGNFAAYSYMSTDAGANRCFFEVDSSATPGCVQIITVAPDTPGANLLCYPSSSSCSYFGDNAGGIPASVINAILNQHWFAAGTDILPADAKFATYRMLAPCGQAIWRQPFDQILRETYGLGYQTSTPGVGAAVQSYYSSASAGVLDFNISGNDPFTGIVVPAYSVSTIGAQPIVVAVSPAGGNGIGAATDITSFVLMNFYDGTLGRATNLLGPSAPSGVTTLVREPQSGDYNVFEWSAVNNSQFHDSQDAFNCNATSGAIISNPLNLLSMNGNAAGLGGQYSYRRRVIGTGEMTAQLQAGTDNDNRLGYFYWSAANAAAFNAGNGKYLTVNGVDPLEDTYTDGVFPGVDAAHPLSNVTFKSLNQGDYPIWSALRLVSQSPTPVAVTNLIAAAQSLASIQHDVIPVSSLTVWHSHSYLPALGSSTAANGNTLNPATPNDLCPGYLPEFGGDAGGANILKQAEYDFCADFGNITGLINKTN